MIKVCMVVHQYYYSDARVRRYAKALADAGAQVDVLCLRDPDQPFAGQRKGVRLYPIPVTRGHKGRASYPLEYGKSFLLFTVWLLGLHIRNRYQVLHVHNMPDFLAFVALIPRVFGAKLILDIHDPMPEFYMSKYGGQTGGMAQWFMRVQEKLSSMLAHAVITANARFKDKLVERGMPADKITVVRNVADPTVFNRDRYEKERRGETKHFTLIYPGTIAPRYGLDVAIRALPRLIQEIPQLRLIIIGHQGEYVNGLVALAEQLGVSSSIRFKAAVPVDEVARLVARADVGIYPALPGPHMSIAMPSKVLEYVAMGIPIIASRLKVLEDSFTDSGIMFFEPGNRKQFARCVLELFSSPARRDELVRNADSVFVQAHPWSVERQAYFDLLNRLLGPKAGMVVVDGKGESSTEQAT